MRKLEPITYILSLVAALFISSCSSSSGGTQSASDEDVRSDDTRIAVDGTNDEQTGTDSVADQSDQNSPDTGTPDSATEDTATSDSAIPDSTNEDSDPPVGFLGQEDQDDGEEWADCISDCAHDIDLQIVDLNDFTLDGLKGTIDAPDHEYTISGATVIGPDVDMLAIVGSSRLVVEITVEPASDESLMDPVITTHDGFQGLAYNSDRTEDDITARTVLAHPYLLGELPFYVVIEDAINYENFGPGGSGYVGGEDYQYIVRFETSEFSPVELGTLAETPLTAADNVLGEGGDIHYFRFQAPNSAQPTVVVTRTGSTSFIPTVVGMKTIEGQLVWNHEVHDNPNSPTGSATLSGASAFDVCHEPCSDGAGEFIFAVLDWNGASFPGEFSYDVSVSLD